MPTIEVSETNLGGQSHELRVGEELVLRLAENPTTGYRWNVASSGDGALQSVDDRYEPGASSPAPGAGGRRVLRFAAVRAGTVHLALTHQRSWEPGGGQSAQLTVNIR